MLKKNVNSSPLKVTIGDEPLPVTFDAEDPIPVQFDTEDPILVKFDDDEPMPVYAPEKLSVDVEGPVRIYTQDILPVEAYSPLPTRNVPLSHVTFFDTDGKQIFTDEFMGTSSTPVLENTNQYGTQLATWLNATSFPHSPADVDLFSTGVFYSYSNGITHDVAHTWVSSVQYHLHYDDSAWTYSSATYFTRQIS